MVKVKNLKKSFLATLFVTVIPVFILFTVFSMQYGADLPYIEGITGSLVVASAAIIIYGFIVSFIGVKRIYKTR